MTVLAPGGMVPEYLTRTNVDRSLSHTPMSRLTTPASTSMRPRTTPYLVMRDEKPVELVGDLVERGLEVRNMVKGLRIFGDVIIETETQHGQLGVAEKSEAIHYRKGCHVRRSEGCVAGHIREHVERAHVSQLVDNRWCDIYTRT